MISFTNFLKKDTKLSNSIKITHDQEAKKAIKALADKGNKFASYIWKEMFRSGDYSFKYDTYYKEAKDMYNREYDLFNKAKTRFENAQKEYNEYIEVFQIIDRVQNVKSATFKDDILNKVITYPIFDVNKEISNIPSNVKDEYYLRNDAMIYLFQGAKGISDKIRQKIGDNLIKKYGLRPSRQKPEEQKLVLLKLTELCVMCQNYAKAAYFSYQMDDPIWEEYDNYFKSYRDFINAISHTLTIPILDVYNERGDEKTFYSLHAINNWREK